jgi:hypothetical protein
MAIPGRLWMFWRVKVSASTRFLEQMRSQFKTAKSASVAILHALQKKFNSLLRKLGRNVIMSSYTPQPLAEMHL